MNFNLSSAEQMVQFAITNKNAILAVVFLFCALVLYKMITSSDWVKIVLGVGLLILIVHSLTACSVTTSHDFGGFTERAQLRANAQSTQVAERAQADVAIAESNAKGLIESTRLNADAKVASNQAWAGTLPIALLIAGLAALLCIGMYWRGRVGLQYAKNDGIRAKAGLVMAKTKYLQAEQAGEMNILETVQNAHLFMGPRPTPLTEAQLQLLAYYAQKHDLQVRVIEGEHYLVDQAGNQQRVKPKALLAKPDD